MKKRIDFLLAHANLSIQFRVKRDSADYHGIGRKGHAGADTE